MNISLPVEELRKRSLFVCAPLYAGQNYGSFTKSIADLASLGAHYGLNIKFHFIYNESLITRARTYCADEFMRSGMTHMIFIDSDIGFNANDVISLLALQSDESEYDVLCAPYPKKCISWEKIKQAVDKGVADKNPFVLEKYVGDFVFNPVQPTINLFEPSEVLESGTGFMMIRKATLEKMKEAYPELSYKPDHVRSANFDGSREITMFFDAVIDNKHSHIKKDIRKFFELNPNATSKEVIDFIDDVSYNAEGKPYSKRYLSEDYMFCQWARNIGLKIWLCPWVQLTHTGTFVFGGSLADIASVGASITADPSKLVDKK